MSTKQVLLPLDGSSFSCSMLDCLCRFIGPEDAKVIVLRVTPWPRGLTDSSHHFPPVNWLLPLDPALYDVLPDTERPFQPIYASQEAERARAQIIDELQEQTQQLRAAGYQTRFVVEFGEPAEEIINFIEHHDIDVVAMATHGRSGLGHLVLGSVAEHVLRKVHVPVLLIRPVPHEKGRETNKQYQQDITVPS